MAIVGKADFNTIEPTAQDLITSVIFDNFVEYNTILPLISNESSRVVKGVKSITYNCLSEPDTQKQTFPLTPAGVTSDGTADPDGNPIVCQSLEITQQQLDINCKAVFGVKYDPCDLYQSVLNVESELISKASQALVQQVENDVIAQMIANVDPANILDAASPGTIVEGDLICLDLTLTGKGIPQSDRCFLVNPEDMKYIYSLKCIKEAQVSGDSTSTFRTGSVGTIMGNPVIISRLIPPGQVVLLHKSHVIYANGPLGVMRAQLPKLSCEEMSWCLPYGILAGVKDNCRAAILNVGK